MTNNIKSITGGHCGNSDKHKARKTSKALINIKHGN